MQGPYAECSSHFVLKHFVSSVSSVLCFICICRETNFYGSQGMEHCGSAEWVVSDHPRSQNRTGQTATSASDWELQSEGSNTPDSTVSSHSSTRKEDPRTSQIRCIHASEQVAGGVGQPCRWRCGGENFVYEKARLSTHISKKPVKICSTCRTSAWPSVATFREYRSSGPTFTDEQKFSSLVSWHMTQSSPGILLCSAPLIRSGPRQTNCSPPCQLSRHHNSAKEGCDPCQSLCYHAHDLIILVVSTKPRYVW